MDESEIDDADDETPPAMDKRQMTNDEWVEDVFTADPSLRLCYREAKINYPHLFEGRELATIVSFVEALAQHFARDALTREDCFDALAVQPQLLLRKPSQVISDVETVLTHFDAETPARAAYLMNPIEHAVLFRVSPSAMIASIEMLNAVEVAPALQPGVLLPTGDDGFTLPKGSEADGDNHLAIPSQAGGPATVPLAQETPGTLIDRPLIHQLGRVLARSGRAA